MNKFVQIATGSYSFLNNVGHKLDGHVLYGLSEDMEVWKFVPKENKWFKLENLPWQDPNKNN